MGTERLMFVEKREGGGRVAIYNTISKHKKINEHQIIIFKCYFHVLKTKGKIIMIADLVKIDLN